MTTFVRNPSTNQVQIYTGTLTGVGAQGPPGVISNTYANLADTSVITLTAGTWTTLDYNTVVNNVNCLAMPGPTQYSVLSTGCHSISGSVKVSGTAGDVVVLEVHRFDDLLGEVTLAQEQASIIGGGIDTWLSFSFTLNLRNEAGVLDVLKIVATTTGTASTVADRLVWFARIAVGAPGDIGPSGTDATHENILVWEPDGVTTEPLDDPDDPFFDNQPWFNPSIVPARPEWVQFVYPTAPTAITADGVWHPVDAWGKQRYTTPCQGLVEIVAYGLVTLPDSATTCQMGIVLLDTGDGSIRVIGPSYGQFGRTNNAGENSMSAALGIVTNDSVQLLVQPQFYVTPSGKAVTARYLRLTLKFTPYVAAIQPIAVT